MLPLQSNTVRQWRPVVLFVLHWGERALEAVKAMEDNTKGIGLHTLSKMRAVADPQFLEDVMAAMKDPKCNVNTFTSAVNKAASKMWYSWHVMHPELPVHQDRSVFFSLSVTCLASMFVLFAKRSVLLGDMGTVTIHRNGATRVLLFSMTNIVMTLCSVHCTVYVLFVCLGIHCVAVCSAVLSDWWTRVDFCTPPLYCATLRNAQ